MTSKMIGSPSTQATRRKTWGALRASAVGLSMVLVNAAWAAPTVVFTATDLVDVTAGEDLWRYDYTISGPVDAFGSINLLFSPTLYASLHAQTLDLDLSLLVQNPDVAAPSDGIVFVTPISGLSAAATTTLSVDFTWLGGVGRTPGAQAFDVVDGLGSPAGGGVSRPLNGGSVPEPSALLLAATALLALSARRERGAGA